MGKSKATKVNKYLKNYNKTRPAYNFLSKVIRFFSKKYSIIDLNDGDIKQGSIFISNHSAANGPLKLTLNFPYQLTPWGINNMCQGYKIRRRYLIDIFYRQKLKYGKFKSWIIGTLFAIISGYLYRNAGVIPTFEDSNLIKTINLSIGFLQKSKNILIFPEDSSKGYFEVLSKYFPGFAMLSKIYYKKFDIDLPVYPVYISKKKKLIVIEKPIYINKMIDKGLSLYEIADEAKNITNKMYLKHVSDKKSTK